MLGNFFFASEFNRVAVGELALSTEHLSFMCVHVSAEQGIDLRLVALTLPFVPVKDIAVDSDRQLLLPGYRFETSTHNATCEHFRCYLWNVRQIDIFVS